MKDNTQSRCEEWRFGNKKVFATIDGDSVTVAVDCEVVEALDALLLIPVTLGQWEELKARSRAVQDILPRHPASVREVFISGTTPCEFIETFGGLRLSIEDMRRLGYAIEEENIDYAAHEEWMKEDRTEDDE